jgi:RimJ/RimL family protein N-acetyltransferase
LPDHAQSIAAPNIPTVETERLILRGHRADDLDDSAAMWGDADVVRYIGGRQFSREEVWARLLRYVGHWSLLGYGYWAVHEKASGRFVGEVGLADFKRDLEPRLDAPEVGWVLATWSHGKGFATEAVRAALAWGASQLGAERTVCIIDPPNAASIHVAEKCGYKEVGHLTYKGSAALLFER